MCTLSTALCHCDSDPGWNKRCHVKPHTEVRCNLQNKCCLYLHPPIFHHASFQLVCSSSKVALVKKSRSQVYKHQQIPRRNSGMPAPAALSCGCMAKSILTGHHRNKTDLWHWWLSLLKDSLRNPLELLRDMEQFRCSVTCQELKRNHNCELAAGSTLGWLSCCPSLHAQSCRLFVT